MSNSSDAPSLRASDAERERTATQLREHTAAGRLTHDELEERLGAAYAARTVAQLQQLVEDLPALPPPGPDGRPLATPREHAKRRVLHAVGLTILIDLAFVLLWAITSADVSFWPKWIIGLSLIRLAFFAWGELGPGAEERHESRLGRGGARQLEADAPRVTRRHRQR